MISKPINNFADFNDVLGDLTRFVKENQGKALEITIGEIEKDKTLKQLGGLFANWIKHLSQTEGDSEDLIHRKLKAMFLARIYIADVASGDNYGKHKEIQSMWVDHLADLQQSGDFEKLKTHAKRISLSWANLSQMKAYMNSIEQHYQSLGVGLPPMKTKGFKEHLERVA